MRAGAVLALASSAVVSLVACQRAAPPPTAAATAPAAVDFGQRIVHADAEPQNWLSTGRDYQETRHSPLAMIDTSNVGQLGLAWSHDLDTHRGQEATPIVIDGVVYTSSAWSKVQAFDGVSGRLLWQFDPQVPLAAAAKACCDAVNRGVAYWDGKVYVGALDGRLIAIDAKTGRQVWSVQTVDASKSYSITGAPRIVKGRVIIGNGGADMGVRGYVSAYDAATGKLSWRFYLVPPPAGQVDHAASDEALARIAAPTWGGAPQGGGGATAWDSFAYDPDLDLVYVGTGNAAFWARKYRDPQSRAGADNLFIGSVLALHAQTGEYAWHYQETPGDQWDYTSTAHMILADLRIGGEQRRVLLHAPKNGFFYVLDRASGKLISAKAYGRVNWARGIDLATGRPIMNPDADYSKTGKLWVGQPATSGAHDWQPMSFDAKSGLVLLPVMEAAQPFLIDPGFQPKPTGWNTGLDIGAPGPAPEDPKVLAGIRASIKGWLVAWDPVKQEVVWRVDHPGMWSGGVLTTDGGLAFQGESSGTFNAYEIRSGRKLWSFDTQTAVMAAPATWSRDGIQYVTVAVGSGGATTLGGGPLLLDEQGRPAIVNRSRVLTFALGKQGHLPPALPLPLPRPQHLEQFADAATVKLGRNLFHRSCFPCHGVEAISSGMVPDLRYSATISDRSVFSAIVSDGVRAQLGMVSFKDSYTPVEFEAIRAYLIDRSQAAARMFPGTGAQR